MTNFLAWTWTIDGSLFAVPASHFERDLKQFSEDTYNEMIKDCIEKETKLNKFIEVFLEILKIWWIGEGKDPV